MFVRLCYVIVWRVLQLAGLRLRPREWNELEIVVLRLIQGALKNLDHRVARSTVAEILKEQGIPPIGGRSTSGQTFLQAHWHAIVAADFFTTEVWTARGLVLHHLCD